MWPWATRDNRGDRIEELKLLVELYRLGVQTQMHFNELILRTRTLGATGLVVILGGAVVIRNQYPAAAFDLGPFIVGRTIVGPVSIPVAAAVALLGMVLVIVLDLLDRNYYMKLLKGATIYVYRIEDFAENAGMTIAGYGEAFRQSRHIRDAIGGPDASVGFVKWSYRIIGGVTALLFLLLLLVPA